MTVPADERTEITQACIDAWHKDKPAFSVVNYANADMVGHTGNRAATIRAVETVDQQLNILVDALHKDATYIIITADHGNAEQLKNPSNQMIDTEHSTNPVPCILIRPEDIISPMMSQSEDQRIAFASQEPVGLLADIAPTIIELLALQQPQEMTGQSLCATMTT